ARAAVRAALASAAEAAPPEARGILEAQALLVDDDALVRPARRAVLEEGRSAARAWSDASSAVVRAYEELDDDYQRARGADVADVCRRVLRALAGGAAGAAAGEGIVVAEEITPADAAALEPARVQGIAAARGGPTSHGAIVVRARGIPAVVGLGDEVLGVRDGAVVVVDGDRGRVHVNPSEEELAALRARRARAEEAAVAARARAGDEAVTRSGTRVEVTANVGADDAGAARAEGADGIGLLRTELLFLDRRHPPSEDDQAAAYARAADAMEGRPVIVRTLDAGADKPLPFAPRAPEANPFLGVRGLRLALAEPALLGVQLRAVLRAAHRRPLSVMFPMVTTIAELRAARRVLEEAAGDLERRGVDHANSVPVGVMVEVPAVALRAGVFAAEIDFFSLGTNDLTQYTMAAERGNDQVASLGDAVHPAVLALADAVCRAARAHGRWVGVCGEAAGDPAGAALFVGLGVTELSVAPPAIAAVKERVRALDDDAARALARAALECEDAAAVRALVAERSDGGDGDGA
ncbi:MAG TPA: phosphoenolpyruvate--protein phosphotransferase, partial [Actinomycetota bacterium]|nr:phosphoenolpyruvate--protein phosphotransferase [Actinomycetota bacterium]